MFLLPVVGDWHHSTNSSFLLPNLSLHQTVCFSISFPTTFSQVTTQQSQPQDIVATTPVELNVTTTLERKRWEAREKYSPGIFKLEVSLHKGYFIRVLLSGSQDLHTGFIIDTFRNPNIIASIASLGKYISKNKLKIHIQITLGSKCYLS